MREILFKAKRIDNGEWVEGYYFKARNHWHKHGIHEDWIVVNAIQNGGWCNVCGKYAIDASTLCQYTGLTDKNGKKIWEGDLLGYKMNVVEYCNGEFTISGDRPLNLLNKEFEVIGNIFDNPELMEAGGK